MIRVSIYQNLHRSSSGRKVYSIQSKTSTSKTSLVLGYCSRLHLKDAVFKISESGRLRVLSEKKKNVHAKVEGDLTSLKTLPPEESWIPIRYNPYEAGFFFEKESKKPVLKASGVIFTPTGVFIYK